MYELALTKPDGRAVTFYSRRPIDPSLETPSPNRDAMTVNPHRRWHPLRGEWVLYATHRQARTFLPPPDYNPLLPSQELAAPTELPPGDYDIAVFDNLFPAMTASAHDPPAAMVPTAPADGRCEVVVFTQDPSLSLGRLSLSHLELLIEVWARRSEAIGRERNIRFVLPFENRGEEVGVTLHHPHGQIYAYPFIPPVPRRMQEMQLEHLAARQCGLLESLITAEFADGGRRILYASDHAVAFVPVCARYPYEVWVAPRVATPDFQSLSSAQRRELARALKTTLLKYDGLWGVPFPYIMAWYQAPLDDTPRAAYHLHAQFLPAYRMRGRLKYLAGTEVAAGVFVNDTVPEEKARELQAVEVALG